jgi:hypothetical protein
MTDTAAWVANPTRALTTGGYYRFGVVVPNTMSEDDVIAALTDRGWITKSFGAPPPDIAQALKNLASLGMLTPSAWWAIATWNGPPTVLPTHDGTIYYGPVDQWSVVPAGAPETPQPPPPADEPSILPHVLGFLVGAAIVWLALRAMHTPHARSRA